MECYFFGTFNPVHLGHKEISKQVKEKLGFGRVVFVPAYMPPHKIEDGASYGDRLNMLRLCMGDDCVSDIEAKLKVPSYTYRTIEKLYEEKYGRNGIKNNKINFIIGYDQFFKLESWREPEILREKVHFIVIPRHLKNGQILGSGAFQYFKNKGYSLEILDINFLDISSSMIRKYIAENQDITGLVSLEVKKYIEEHGLYKKTAQGNFIRKEI